MPGYLRGKTRDTYTLVVVNETPLVYYAFYRKDYSGVTGISNNDFLSLGHVTGATPPAGSFTFLRAQAPKPARVKDQDLRFDRLDLSQARVESKLDATLQAISGHRSPD